MKDRTDKTRNDSLTKGAFWASAAFYALVALEFFYMASPFAAYFYSVYGPGLDFLSESHLASWLVGFFLPHIVAQTTSPLVDAHNVAGAILMIAGLAGFAVGAYQVYAAKLRKVGMVAGGIYRRIRHPQYLALMVASFGMLLVWPRFLVLLGFVTVVFVYLLLARAEERQCARRFEGYADYMQRTGMILPRAVEAPFRLISMPRSGLRRSLAWVFCYLATLGIAVGAARAAQSYAIGSLHAHYTDDAAYISVSSLTQEEIADLAAIALADPVVTAAIRRAKEREDARFLNYLLPTEMFVSEIPMHLPPGAVTGHSVPDDHDRNLYKIVFTLVQPRPDVVPSGPSIIADALNKTPVIEAWIDRAAEQVAETYPPPERAFYGGMPVPVF